MLALIVADDLTGACDAAVHFAARGAQTRVHWAGDPISADVTAFSTESRALNPTDIAVRMNTLAPFATARRPEVIFKKIDSVLRGQTGCEIAAAREAFGCDMAIITPASPALGRTVRNGMLYIEGESEAMDVAAKLSADGLKGGFHGSLYEGLDGGFPYISVDAATHADLERVVSTALELKNRILWVGSGGLAAALASVLCKNAISTVRPAINYTPVMFCIGSTHQATLRQQRELLAGRPAVELSADEADPASAANALARGKHVLLHIARGLTPVERIRAVLCAARPETLFCCGGDTASLVFDAMGVSGVELHGEVATGVPWGSIAATKTAMNIATKSGGFGGPDALIQVADYFTCTRN